MVTLNSPATAHTMSIASLGLTGRGRVRRRERVERRSQTVRKRVNMNINININIEQLHHCSARASTLTSLRCE